MKSKNFLMVFACISLVAAFSACKKDGAKTTSDEITTTVELSGDQAISDNTNADAEYILNEAAVNNNFAGNTPTGITSTLNILDCPTVTVSSGAFPKTISIDFAGGCVSASGITRSGKINVMLSDSLRKSGSVATMTFDNYYVGGFKKEGTITWTNTSQQGTKSWTRQCTDGKITAPGGRFWLHSGAQTVVQTDGVSTPFNLLDDVFSTTGSATVTNSADVSRTAEITSALEKKVLCDNIDKGTIKITGPNHYAIIDYGDGSCDREATISIDGSNPITFLLR